VLVPLLLLLLLLLVPLLRRRLGHRLRARVLGCTAHQLCCPGSSCYCCRDLTHYYDITVLNLSHTC
jgi:hypothetical protein